VDLLQRSLQLLVGGGAGAATAAAGGNVPGGNVAALLAAAAAGGGAAGGSQQVLQAREGAGEGRPASAAAGAPIGELSEMIQGLNQVRSALVLVARVWVEYVRMTRHVCLVPKGCWLGMKQHMEVRSITQALVVDRHQNTRPTPRVLPFPFLQAGAEELLQGPSRASGPQAAAAAAAAAQQWPALTHQSQRMQRPGVSSPRSPRAGVRPSSATPTSAAAGGAGVGSTLSRGSSPDLESVAKKEILIATGAFDPERYQAYEEQVRAVPCKQTARWLCSHVG